MANLSEGVTYEEIDETLIKEFNANQKGNPGGFVRLQPFNQCFSRSFLTEQKRCMDFPARDDDVWISSFPKCGTTWTQEMVWNIMNDSDFATAKSVNLDERVPFFEMYPLTDETFRPSAPDTVKQVAKMKSPRIVKTHFSYEMLPTQVREKKCKLVYVTRNPRDTVVSFFNHWKVLEGYTGSFELFVDTFLNDVCGYYTPFLEHVLSYYEKKDNDNVCFITYEEMKANLAKVITKVANFLGKTVPEGKKMAALVEHLSFDKMKNNNAVNKSDMVEICNQHYQQEMEGNAFMRKGQTGNWRKHFTPELEKRFDEWEKEGLKDSELTFTYDI